MSNVISRTTGDIRYSVHTPDYPKADWLINPRSIGAVVDVPAHYRIVEADVVREATASEKDVIDQQRLPQLKGAKRDNIGEILREILRAASIKELDAVMAAAATKYGKAVAQIEAATTVAALATINVEI